MLNSTRRSDGRRLVSLLVSDNFDKDNRNGFYIYKQSSSPLQTDMFMIASGSVYCMLIVICRGKNLLSHECFLSVSAFYRKKSQYSKLRLVSPWFNFLCVIQFFIYIIEWWNQRTSKDHNYTVPVYLSFFKNVRIILLLLTHYPLHKASLQKIVFLRVKNGVLQFRKTIITIKNLKTITLLLH